MRDIVSRLAGTSEKKKKGKWGRKNKITLTADTGG